MIISSRHIKLQNSSKHPAHHHHHHYCFTLHSSWHPPLLLFSPPSFHSPLSSDSISYPPPSFLNFFTFVLLPHVLTVTLSPCSLLFLFRLSYFLLIPLSPPFSLSRLSIFTFSAFNSTPSLNAFPSPTLLPFHLCIPSPIPSLSQVPFGEVSMVKDWLGVSGSVGKPLVEHPQRPVLGFECHRSEVRSGHLRRKVLSVWKFWFLFLLVLLVFVVSHAKKNLFVRRCLASRTHNGGCYQFVECLPFRDGTAYQRDPEKIVFFISFKRSPFHLFCQKLVLTNSWLETTTPQDTGWEAVNRCHKTSARCSCLVLVYVNCTSMFFMER